MMAKDEIKKEIKNLKGYNPENYDIESEVFNDRLVLESQVIEIIDRLCSNKEKE